jgi:RNA polymerase sigma factor (sigma-70 family)
MEVLTMRKYRTPQNQRATYIYENGIEIRPGENGVTEVDIEMLHRFDDEEWNQYHADTRNDLKSHSAPTVSIEVIDTDGVWLKNIVADPFEILLAQKDEEMLVSRVRNAIEKLPSKQREAVTAVWLDGMTASDYAKSKSVTEAAVSQILSRSFNRLKKIFKKLS